MRRRKARNLPRKRWPGRKPRLATERDRELAASLIRELAKREGRKLTWPDAYFNADLYFKSRHWQEWWDLRG